MRSIWLPLLAACCCYCCCGSPAVGLAGDLSRLSAAASVSAPAPAPLVVEWSDAVLVEPFTYHLVVPDHFYGFDDRHMYGMGFNGSWAFSSDAGKRWTTTHTPSNVPHGLSPMLPLPADPDVAGAPHTYRSLGGGIFVNGDRGWTLQWPRVYALLPNGSGFTIEVATGGAGPNHNVTFRGVPFPGVNVSAHTVVKSGTRNYGVTRAANEHYVLQTDVLWNGQPVYHAHGTTFVELSICSFTSVDGYSWQWGGVIANWSAVVGNVTDPRPGDVLNPVMWGPSECDVALLSDNKTLFSVLRMDGDSGCFAVDVPPKDRDANHTTYRNYAGSFSTDNGVSWSLPQPIEGTGCARPRLKKLDSGALLLTGGRLCVENQTGIFLWVNRDGMAGFNTNSYNKKQSKSKSQSQDDGSRGRGDRGREKEQEEVEEEVWVRHSITAAHNRLWKGDPHYLFSEMVNDSSVFETLSYTSIVPTGYSSAVITYNKFDYEKIGTGNMSWPGPSANFAISVTIA